MRDYDAGLLNDFGGGDVGWWQDYLRAEIGRANDHWRTQMDALTAERDALRDGLEAACDVQNWIEDNVPDDLFERVPTEPWNRITEAVIIARANNPTSRNETAV